MKIGRRGFMAISLMTAAGVTRPLLSQKTTRHQRVKALALDGFVIFDPRAVTKCVERMFPGRGTEFTDLWRNTQFQYTWLRTIGGRYKEFEQIIQDALDHVAITLGLSLTPAQREGLLSTHSSLPPWPDVIETLKELRRRGIRVAFLSDFSAAVLDTNLAAAKLAGYFEPHLTTDRVRAFKPSPLAYEMGRSGFGLERDEIAFVAFGAWDAVGAKWFGYPTVWVNRIGAHQEELDTQPDAVVTTFRDVLFFLDTINRPVHG